MGLGTDRRQESVKTNVQFTKPSTCMRGTSFGSFFLRSSSHFNGSLRGEKSVTTAPRWRSDTKPGRTSPTEPRSRWNWISKASHSCSTVAEESHQQVKDGDGSNLP